MTNEPISPRETLILAMRDTARYIDFSVTKSIELDHFSDDDLDYLPAAARILNRLVDEFGNDFKLLNDPQQLIAELLADEEFAADITTAGIDTPLSELFPDPYAD